MVRIYSGKTTKKSETNAQAFFTKTNPHILKILLNQHQFHRKNYGKNWVHI